MKACCFTACLFTVAGPAAAAVPSLSVSLVSSANVQVSWSTNFAIQSWQLVSTTNLFPGDWQPVPTSPFLAVDAFSVSIPFTDSGRFFRLQQVGGTTGGGCAFQAAPSVITAGASSTLTWCSQAGTSYNLSPGPGPVTGGSLPVSPTVTTVYSLTASNASGMTTNFAAVIVNPCGWLQVQNWTAKLFFAYTDSGSTSDYNFSIAHQVGSEHVITFNLTLQAGSTATDAYYFGTATGGSAYINDREDVKTPSLFTTTEVGSGSVALNVSYLSLHVTCTSYDFNYNVVMNTTETSQFGVTTSLDGVGTGAMASRALPSTNDVIIDNVLVHPQYPPVSAEYFVPSSDLGTAALRTGVLPSGKFLSDAVVDWEFAPIR